MKGIAGNFLIIISIIALSTLGSCKKDKAPEDKKVVKVEVAYPEVREVVLTENYPGNLMALQQVDIMARVDGIIQKVHVASGSKVKKGELLYTIENTKYLDAYNQAKAQLATAQSSYAYYSRQVEALERAYQGQAVSEMELIQGKSNLEQAAAQIENYKAALSNAQTMLGYCEVRAPFDGTLSLQTFDEGAYVNGETNPVKLNTIYNDNVLYAYISIPENKFIQLKENSKKQGLSLDSVLINFAEPLAHTYYSRINYSAPDVNSSTGTVTLRFNLENPYSELKPGMFINVSLPFARLKNAFLIKDASIGTDQAGNYVYLVNDSNKVVYHPIETGEVYQDTLRIVTSGLHRGSRYVTDALLKVRNGMKVEPIVKK